LAFLIALLVVNAGRAFTSGYSEQRTTGSSNERRRAPTSIDKQLRAVSLDEVDRSKTILR
jgi:hypothetical protein